VSVPEFGENPALVSQVLEREALAAREQITAQVTVEVTAQVTAQVGEFCKEPRSSKEIMELLELKHWKTFQTNYLNPLLDAEVIQRTIPDKPQSKMQKYRLTEKGWLLLKRNL
jgi:ATP-dependent DNA helicase RecG